MLALAMTTLLLAPWKGRDLPTASAAAVKYELTIKNTPGTSVELHANRVADGWIAAFCDTRVCSPERVRVTVPATGSVTLQFELIREDAHAAKTTGAVITTDDGASAVIKGR